MAAIAASLQSGIIGPSPAEQGMIAEPVTITGTSSVGGETVAYTPSFVSDPQYVKGGGFSYTISNGVVTIKAEHAVGSDVETVEVVGFP